MAGGGSTRRLNYNAYRTTARSMAQHTIRGDNRLATKGLIADLIRIGPIDAEAMQAYWGWQANYGFPWHKVAKWKADDAKAIDLALWYDAGLCGMCFATPRRSKLCIKMILLERSPGDGNPLRGLVGAFLVIPLLRYAQQLGLQEIEVEDPLPGAIALYELIGFKFLPGQRGLRLVRRIDE